jgi:hypothetical protein
LQLRPPDSILGSRNARNVLVAHYGKYLYLTNEQGFMSSGSADFYYPKEKEAGVFRIMVVGGSTVMGQGSFVPRQNLPAQIGRFLSQLHPGLRFEVINAAGFGNDSRREFLSILTELVLYQPDLFVVYDGWNDQATSTSESLAGPDEIRNRLKTEQHYAVDQQLRRSFSVLGSVGLVFGNVKVALSESLNGLATTQIAGHAISKLLPREAREPSERQRVASKNGVRKYKENLEQMVLISDYYNIKIALFLQPILGVGSKIMTAEEKSFLGLLDALALRSRLDFYTEARLMFSELARQHEVEGTVCVEDLSQSFAGISEPLYVDSGHLVPRGNEVIGKIIVDTLVACHVVAGSTDVDVGAHYRVPAGQSTEGR